MQPVGVKLFGQINVSGDQQAHSPPPTAVGEQGAEGLRVIDRLRAKDHQRSGGQTINHRKAVTQSTINQQNEIGKRPRLAVEIGPTVC